MLQSYFLGNFNVGWDAAANINNSTTDLPVGYGIESLSSTVGFGANHKAGLSVDKLYQALTDSRMAANNQNHCFGSNLLFAVSYRAGLSGI
jgi:hypothetical protein